jgi:hypothetical protein
MPLTEICSQQTYDHTKHPSDFGWVLSPLWRSINFDCTKKSIYFKCPFKKTTYPEQWSAKYVGYLWFNNKVHRAVSEGLTKVSEKKCCHLQGLSGPQLFNVARNDVQNIILLISMKYFLAVSKVTIVLSKWVYVTRIGYTLFTQATHYSTLMISSTKLLQSSPSVHYISWMPFQCFTFFISQRSWVAEQLHALYSTRTGTVKFTNGIMLLL